MEKGVVCKDYFPAFRGFVHMNLFSKKKASKGTGIVTRRGGLIDRKNYARIACERMLC